MMINFFFFVQVPSLNSQTLRATSRSGSFRLCCMVRDQHPSSLCYPQPACWVRTPAPASAAASPKPKPRSTWASLLKAAMKNAGSAAGASAFSSTMPPRLNPSLHPNLQCPNRLVSLEHLCMAPRTSRKPRRQKYWERWVLVYCCTLSSAC